RSLRGSYPFSGIIRCSHCGERFHGHTQPRTVPVRYYRHALPRGAEGGSCPHAHAYLQADDLEAHLLAVAKACLQDGRIAELVRGELERRRGDGESKARARERLRLEKQVQESERRLRTFLRNLGDQDEHDRVLANQTQLVRSELS